MKPLSKKWTAEDRLRVIAAMLPDMQADIYAGRYSEMGRPNVTSLQHVLFESAEDLEPYREEMEKKVSAYEGSEKR